MSSGTLPPPPATKYNPRSLLAAALCVMALFLDLMGWLLGIIGIILLRRSVFPRRVKWTLAAIALAPKVLFLCLRTLSAPQGLSFTIEPRTLATSSALWIWAILLGALGLWLLFGPMPSRRAPNAPIQPAKAGPILLRLAGLIPIVIGVVLLLGLLDDFQRIEDAGGGRWALKHAVRGTTATFTRDEVASIEGSTSRGRGTQPDSVRIRLTNGRTYSVSTTSPGAFQTVRQFATTADLRPGTVHISPRFGSGWTNGASGFTLNECVGRYEYLDQALGERSTIEFWLQNGRLAGKETTVNGERRYVRPLREIKISDNGELEFRQDANASMERQAETISFHWSSGGGSGKEQGDTARFTRDGLQIGVKSYRKL